METQCCPWAQQLLLFVEPFVVKELKSTVVELGPFCAEVDGAKLKELLFGLSLVCCIRRALVCPPCQILQSLIG